MGFVAALGAVLVVPRQCQGEVSFWGGNSCVVLEFSLL